MNLKEILTSVLQYLGEEPDSSYISNVNTDYSRLVVIANSAVADIIKIHEWGKLKKKATLSIIDGTNLYDLPNDFDRLINDTSFSNNREVDLPSSDSVIAYHNQYGSSYNYHGRLLGNQVEFTDVPSGTLTFGYISNAVINGANTQRFTSDNDEWLLDDELIIRAIKQRYTAQTGENDAIALQDVQSRLNQLKKADVGARSFNINEQRNPNYYPYKR